jgi:prevent-host-death family protein
MIDIARDIDSLSEFKRNTKEFIARLKKTGSPVVLTINGKAAVVVQDASAFQKVIDQESRREMEDFLRESLADADAGRTVDAARFVKTLGTKAGKQRRKRATS